MSFATPDWTSTTRELCRALRGRRSRDALARAISCSPNAVYAWETGRRIPPATVVLQMIAATGIDVLGSLTPLLGTEEPGPSPDPAALVLHTVTAVRGRRPVAELAAVGGWSRFAVSRWLSGRAAPRMPDFLGLVHVATGRALDLVARWVDPQCLRSTRAAWTALNGLREGARRAPWSLAMYLALDQRAYLALPRHEPGVLAQRLSLTLEEEQEGLALLVRHGAIRWNGTRYVAEPNPLLSSVDDATRHSVQGWAAQLAERHLRAGSDGRFTTSMFVVSSEVRRELEQLHAAYVRRVYALTSVTLGDEHLMIGNIHLFAV